MKVTGKLAVIKALERFGDKSRKLVSNTVQATAYQITAEAKQNAPTDLGQLKNSIVNRSENDGLRGVVEVGAMHGPFVEFGTGIYVDVPAELAQEAIKFKGFKSGSFEEFLIDIKSWCKRHGIEEAAAYPIAMSILKKGIKPQPYLYPAFVKHRAELPNKLKKVLERLIKEANG